MFQRQAIGPVRRLVAHGERFRAVRRIMATQIEATLFPGERAPLHGATAAWVVRLDRELVAQRLPRSGSVAGGRAIESATETLGQQHRVRRQIGPDAVEHRPGEAADDPPILIVSDFARDLKCVALGADVDRHADLPLLHALGSCATFSAGR